MKARREREKERERGSGSNSVFSKYKPGIDAT